MFKLKSIGLTFLSFIIASSASVCYMQNVKASSKSIVQKQWSEKKYINSRKVWKLTFRQGLLVDPSSLNNYITVTDSTGTKIDVFIIEANFGQNVLIYPPRDGYDPKKTYYLNISNNLNFYNKSNSSFENLNKPITMKFTVNDIRTINVDNNSLVTESNNKFSCDLIKQLINKNKDKNIIISPLGIETILAETQNGAKGQTKDEILNIFELNSADDKTINEQFYNLLNYYNNSFSSRLNVTNSTWVNKDTTLNDQFVDTSKKYYNSEIKTLDFKDKDSVNVINNWVSQSTDGQIKKILNQLKENEKTILINSANFNGTWLDEFNPCYTNQENFNLSNGKKIYIDNLEDKRVCNYLKGDNFKAISLPYYGGLEMDLFLPDKGIDINNFILTLNKDNINKWMSDFYDAKVNMKIPKFKFSYEENNLANMLKTLGINTAFDKQKADFSGISSKEPLYISNIQHNAYINIDEKGTEASAITLQNMTGTLPPKQYEDDDFFIDRPFIFTIRDHNTGTILFIGKVENPSNN